MVPESDNPSVRAKTIIGEKIERRQLRIMPSAALRPGMDHGVPAHEVEETLWYVSLATSSRCTHARLAPDTRPLLILQKPTPSIFVGWESLLAFTRC